MAETNQDSLLNKLLKSRYPLTYYLSRQQKFVNTFLANQINGTSTSSESETSVIYKRKTRITNFSNESVIIHPRISELDNAQNMINIDQHDNTTHG
ncbi:unnamed protein product [Rotaria sp. Silwood2]|nr:unnamed protein product [Rotaria sp. Silwood2]